MSKKQTTSTARAKPTRTPYSTAVCSRILDRMAEGESLRSICAEPAMPNRKTFLKWVDARPELAERYVEAQARRADCLFDEILEIADTTSPGDRVKTLPDGTQEITTGDCVERSRLKVHARQWAIGRMAPKKYGKTVHNEITGADGQPLGQGLPRPTADELAAFSRELMAGATDGGLSLDGEALEAFSEVIATYAAGEALSCDPRETGEAFARIRAIRESLRRNPTSDSEEKP